MFFYPGFFFFLLLLGQETLISQVKQKRMSPMERVTINRSNFLFRISQTILPMHPAILQESVDLTHRNSSNVAELLPSSQRTRRWACPRGGPRRRCRRRRGARPRRSARRVWVENKDSSPNTNTGYQPNIKSCPNIDIPWIISNLSGI